MSSERDAATGIDDFASDNQGWSVCAFESGIEPVLDLIRSRSDVAEVVGPVTPVAMAEGAGCSGAPEVRHTFLVALRGRRWCFLARTVHWARGEDIDFVQELACDVSRELSTCAFSGSDDDFASPELRLYENGEESLRSSSYDEEGGYDLEADEGHENEEAFDAFCRARGLYIPECFIDDEEGDEPALLVDKDWLQEVEVAWRITFNVAPDDQTHGPHLMHKLNKMRELLARGSDDE